jgi:hypothetical protein
MPDNNRDAELFLDLLFGVILFLVLAYYGWKYWKHKASERWPKVAAIFEGGSVGGATEDGLELYCVAMTFTYQVAGQTYHGQYKKWLWQYSESAARALLESLREGPIYVRYRPSKPKNYVCDPFRDVRP